MKYLSIVLAATFCLLTISRSVSAGHWDGWNHDNHADWSSGDWNWGDWAPGDWGDGGDWDSNCPQVYAGGHTSISGANVKIVHQFEFTKVYDHDNGDNGGDDNDCPDWPDSWPDWPDWGDHDWGDHDWPHGNWPHHGDHDHGDHDSGDYDWPKHDWPKDGDHDHDPPAHDWPHNDDNQDHDHGWPDYDWSHKRGSRDDDGDSQGFTFRAGYYDVTGGDYEGDKNYEMIGGVLKGKGRVGGAFHQSGGLFAPGHSPGLVEFENGYSLTGSGVLELEIQGAGGAPGIDHDFLNVTGTALLDSTVSLILLGGFRPEDGFTVDLLTATDIVLGENFVLDQSGVADWNGLFDLSIVDGGNGELLRLTAQSGAVLSFAGSANAALGVPEPSAIALWTLAAAALFGCAHYRLRRRLS